MISKIDCATARARLAAGTSSDAALSVHLGSCSHCSGIAERWATYRHQISARRLDVDPGPALAARVRARIEDPWQQLGWSGLRLLPIAASLVLLIGWWAATTPTDPLFLLANGVSDDAWLAVVSAPMETPSP